MARLEKFLLYVIFLTLGTYAVPQLRLGLGATAVPFTVPLSFVLAGLIALNRLRDQGRIRLAPMLLCCTYIYIFSLISSTFVAKEPNWALIVKYALMALIPILVSLAIQDEATLNVALVCLTITGLAVFAYGVYGYFGGQIGDPVERTLGYFGITYTTSTRNSDMLFLMATFWLMFGYYFFRIRQSHKILDFLLLVVLMAFVGAMVLSLSRGTWVSVVITILFLSLLRANGRLGSRQPPVWIFLIAGITVVGGLYFLLPPEQWDLVALRSRLLFSLSTEGGNSNAARIALAGDVFQVIISHPLGVGVGNLRFYLSDFSYGTVNHAENVYLQILGEQGILGLISFSGLLFWVAIRLFRTGRDRIGLVQAAPLFALLAIVVNWAIYGMLNNLVDNLWFWTVFGLSISLTNLIQTKSLKHAAQH